MAATKQMEYTIKVVTDGPIAGSELIKALVGDGDDATGVEGVTFAEVTNFRVKPSKKA